MPVVVVESPAKAKTINKYLGSGFTVLASYGHIRDLPPKDGSVDTENNFDMIWEVGADSKKHIKAIADALKEDNALILATDPDREGEAISWHLEETLRKRKVLKKDTPVSRVVFNAITKKSRDRSDEQPARSRCAIGGCLPSPTCFGLFGRVQSFSGFMAQTARGEIGWARTIGMFAHDRRARTGNRSV